MAGNKNHYRNVYFLLLALFSISVMGPEVAHLMNLEGGVRLALVLTTAFGIALVKAYFVCVHFMHLKVEKIYAPYILLACLSMVAVFFFGTATDAMKPEGHNWHKTYVEPPVLAHPGHGGHEDHNAEAHVHEEHGHEDHH